MKLPANIQKAIQRDAKEVSDYLIEQIEELFADLGDLPRVVEKYIEENDLDSMEIYEIQMNYIEAYLSKYYSKRAGDYINKI